MNKWSLAVLVSFMCSQLAYAGGEQAANGFIEYWNMGQERDARNEVVFTREFLDRRGGASGLHGLMTMVYDDNGEIALRNITRSSDDQVEFLVSSEKENWMQITLGLAPDQRVSSFAIDVVPAPPADEDKGLDDQQMASRLEAWMDKRAAAGGFSGSVLLANQGDILFARAYGLADRDRNIENTLDTPINLGSMNKMFTGIAIAQLVAQGKLAYNDTVGKYLPDYPDRQVRDEVTVEQLLTHTSGLGSYWNEAYRESKDGLSSVGDFAGLCAGQPLEFEPGSDYNYSNCGPVVLGLIIEAISGQDYYSYIRTHVYAPAGMKHSDHYDKVETESGKATGYMVPRDSDSMGLTSNFDDLGRIGSPAGGGYASANDMLMFANALYDERLIDAAHREEMTTVKVQEGPDDGYAYLFGDFRLNGQRYIGHNGGAPGISAEFSVFPDSGYTIVVLSNTDHDAFPVANRIRQWVAYRE